VNISSSSAKVLDRVSGRMKNMAIAQMIDVGPNSKPVFSPHPAAVGESMRGTVNPHMRLKHAVMAVAIPTVLARKSAEEVSAR